MSIPFHKQTDPNKQAGQVVFSPPVPNTSFDREPYLKHSNVAPDVTLSDYIARKQEEPQRITFDKWIADNEDASAESIWYAALRYGKVS
jgi:hypothetical protein